MEKELESFEAMVLEKAEQTNSVPSIGLFPINVWQQIILSSGSISLAATLLQLAKAFKFFNAEDFYKLFVEQYITESPRLFVDFTGEKETYKEYYQGMHKRLRVPVMAVLRGHYAMKESTPKSLLNPTSYADESALKAHRKKYANEDKSLVGVTHLLIELINAGAEKLFIPLFDFIISEYQKKNILIFSLIELWLYALNSGNTAIATHLILQANALGQSCFYYLPTTIEAIAETICHIINKGENKAAMIALMFNFTSPETRMTMLITAHALENPSEPAYFYNKNPLLCVALLGDVELLRIMENKVPKLNDAIQSPIFAQMLKVACRRGNLEMAFYLLSRADISKDVLTESLYYLIRDLFPTDLMLLRARKTGEVAFGIPLSREGVTAKEKYLPLINKLLAAGAKTNIKIVTKMETETAIDVIEQMNAPEVFQKLFCKQNAVPTYTPTR